MGKQLISFDVKTMTSEEIHKLLPEVRYDNLIRSIERLVSSGVIKVPPPLEVMSKNNHLRKVYFLDKKSSYVVVAQLNPLFLAAIVDRWQELEDQAKKLDRSWKDVRGLTIDCFKEMCESLNEQRNISGKKTKAYHFSNEARMINQIVLGVDSINRDNQEITVLKQIDNLSRTNISLINAGMDYKSRKSILERALPKKVTFITYED